MCWDVGLSNGWLRLCNCRELFDTTALGGTFGYISSLLVPLMAGCARRLACFLASGWVGASRTLRVRSSCYYRKTGGPSNHSVFNIRSQCWMGSIIQPWWRRNKH